MIFFLFIFYFIFLLWPEIHAQAQQSEQVHFHGGASVLPNHTFLAIFSLK